MSRVVVITGAASGLGLSLSRHFLQSGDRVFGVTRTQRHWNSAKKNLKNSEQFSLDCVDVSSESQVRQYLVKIKGVVNRIDILINCAGYGGKLAPVEKLELSEFQNHLSNNLVSTFLMCKHLLPVFKKTNAGWIVNVASYAGKRAVPLMSAYSSSKFGVVALSQSIAKENPKSRFKCVTVCPGGINTSMRVKLFGAEEAQRQQSADFVAEKIVAIIEGKIPIESGGDVVIRHGKVAAINPLPEA